jgi:nicotinamide mononucleotide (NMN) deamidase PncC
MKTGTHNLIEAIHSSGFKACIVVSGGGSAAVHDLLSHPGASRFVLEAQVPYSLEAMFDYLGEKLEQYCSEDAARTMARRAFERAMVFSMTGGGSEPFIGISCTAALRTVRERRGEDRAFICVKSRRNELVREITFSSAERAGQEEEIRTKLFDAVAGFLGISNEG